MASIYRTSNADEIRMRNYRQQLERQNEIDIKDIDAKHVEQMQHLAEDHQIKSQSLKNGFDVRISEEAEALDDELQRVRRSNEERIITEKQAGDDELGRIRTANTDRLNEFKKNSEFQLEKLRRDLQMSAEAMKKQARPGGKKGKEGISV